MFGKRASTSILLDLLLAKAKQLSLFAHAGLWSASARMPSDGARVCMAIPMSASARMPSDARVCTAIPPPTTAALCIHVLSPHSAHISSQASMHPSLKWMLTYS
eukprot:1152352-Pelagomonas_calceolata.AAC.7